MDEDELMFENNHEDDQAIIIVGGYSIVVTRDEQQEVLVTAKHLETEARVSMILGKEDSVSEG